MFFWVSGVTVNHRPGIGVAVEAQSAIDGNICETAISLASLPATSAQRRFAFAIAGTLVVACAAVAPFARIPLPRLDGFIPSVVAVVFVTDLITAVLLFAYISIDYSRRLFVLATGYLFTALIVLPHVLTFPGAFSPSGLLGAGPQSAPWFYMFWHCGFPMALLLYALLKDDKGAKRTVQAPMMSAITGSAAFALTLVCGLTWLATGGAELLPTLFVDIVHPVPIIYYLDIFDIVTCVVALAALFFRRPTLLDQWLMLVIVAWILEAVLIGLLNPGRFTVGYYAGRTLSLVTSTAVLAVLLAQTTMLYSRLAHANVMLQRERDNKLMTLHAVVASISHELRQPLTAIAANAATGRLLLRRETTDTNEARSVMDDLVDDSDRVRQVLDNFSDLFGKEDQRYQPINMNEITAGALHALRRQLRDRDIATSVEFASQMPIVVGHKGQLQEVLLNLIQNSIEAMDFVEPDGRRLKLRTVTGSGRELIVQVEDSGPGIDPKKINTIFNAFVTTKPGGTGLGLALCRKIIERHGGQLTASSDGKSGTLLQVALPIKPIG